MEIIHAMDYQEIDSCSDHTFGIVYIQLTKLFNKTFHRLVDSLRHLFPSLFVNPEIIRLSRSPDWPWYTITESRFYKSDPKADNKKKNILEFSLAIC